MFRSAPMFWTGMIGILIFGIMLGLLPTSGMRTLPYQASGFFDKITTVDFLWHLTLRRLSWRFIILARHFLSCETPCLKFMAKHHRNGPRQGATGPHHSL